MSIHWKKNSLRVAPLDPAITNHICSDTSEVLNLSNNNKIDRNIEEDSIISSNSDLTFKQEQSQDGLKNEQGEQIKPKTRNPKCARCANHEEEPVAVKGHKRKCRYKECVCNLCLLTVQRRELMAKTIREKRKQKEDLADKSWVFNKPVFKKHRTDDCLSETDRDSGYNTEDNEKSKLIDNISEEEKKQRLEEMFSTIIRELLENKPSYVKLVQSMLILYLKENMTAIIKQNLTPKAIKERIFEASKQIPLYSMPTELPVSPVVPIPLTPLTPNTPFGSPFMTPPSCISSTGSANSSTKSFCVDNSSLIPRNYPLFYPLMSQLGPKGQYNSMVFNMAPVLNH